MDTIDTILKAAYELFSERGYERTPVSEIAKRAGVAAGTVIYHFKTKENLLRILNWFTINRLYSDIRRRTLGAPNGLEATRLYVDGFFDFISSHHREFTLFMETYAHISGPGPNTETLNMDINIQTIRSGLGQLMETLVEDGLTDGSIAPVHVQRTSLGILSTLIGAARLTLFHGVPRQEIREAAEEFIASHLGPANSVAGRDTSLETG